MSLNKENILKLAWLLEKEARNPTVTFNMRFWGMVYDTLQPHSCNTTCCAMGLAALSGEFPGLDYKVVGRRLAIYCTDRDKASELRSKYFLGLVAPEFLAAMVVFGTNPTQTMKIFVNSDNLPDDGIGPKAKLALAKQLRNLVRNENRHSVEK